MGTSTPQLVTPSSSSSAHPSLLQPSPAQPSPRPALVLLEDPVTTERPCSLDAEVAAELRAIARSLPPLSDDQLDSLADLLVQIDLRRAGEVGA